MKKITVREATEEQIANHIRRYPEYWGIHNFYFTECACTKNDQLEELEVELDGCLYLSPFSFAGGERPDAKLTLRLREVDWDSNIEFDEDDMDF